MLVTFGEGLKQPLGHRVEVAGVEGLAHALESATGAVEGWWSPHTWREDYRDSEAWEGASCIGIDLDLAGHAPLPVDVAVQLEQLAGESALSGSIFHRTPAGARLIFVLAATCTDAADYVIMARGAARGVEDDLREHGLDHLGLTIDPKPHADLGRLYFNPNTIAKGAKRSARVIIMRSLAYPAANLRELAPAPTERATQATTTRRLTAVSDPAKRAAAYIRAMGYSVAGNHGDDHAFKVAATLINDFSLPDGEARRLFEDWNTGCEPPWPDRDVERFLRSASKNGKHPAGAKLLETRPYQRNGVKGGDAPVHETHTVAAATSGPVVDADAGPEPTPPADLAEEPARASPEQLLGLIARPCNPARLRERQELRFVSLADLPERHGWGEFMDKLTGGGLAPGSIVGLGAAGTGAGKSAFLMQLLDGLAMRSSFVAENPEATEPLTPIMLLSEMDPEDLEARTLGRLLDAPGNVFLAGRSAKRWHKWSWVDSHYDNAAALMAPAGLYSRLASWQRVARPNIYGPALVECVEAAMLAWVAEIRGAHPGHEVVPIIAVDPINRFLATDGRSEVETLGEIAALLDRLADARKWVGLIPADTNKNAARDPSQAPNAASVFRGTMQLLHACDLILVLEPGDSDPDGVRDYAVILDKNRYGRNGVGLNFRWHTRTGLRFIPETEEEWKARSGEANPRRRDDSAQRGALVDKVAELAAAGVVVTRNGLRPHAAEIGVARDSIVALVDSAILHCELQEVPKPGRGGGKMLLPLESSSAKSTAEGPATSLKEVDEGPPATSGDFGDLDLMARKNSETKSTAEVDGESSGD